MMKTRGCLAYRGYFDDRSPNDIYLLPLPDSNPIALSEWVPIEKNALRIRIGGILHGAPGRAHSLKFAPTGDQLLFLGDRQTEWEEIIHPRLTIDELMFHRVKLYLADLRRRTISHLDIGGAFKEQDYRTCDWTAQGLITATRGNTLLMIDPYAWQKDPNHIAQSNKDFWVLTNDAQWHAMTPDRRGAYFLNRRGRRFGYMSCERNAKVRWLPAIPHGHGEAREALTFPTDTGLMFATITPKEAGGYGSKTLWAWQRGETSYRQVSRVSSDVAIVSYLHERSAFLLSDELTKYFDIPRFKDRSWVRLGLCSARSGKIDWFRVDHPQEAVPATGLQVLQSSHPGSPIVVLTGRDRRKSPQDWWSWIGVLNVRTMLVQWVRRYWYGEVWAWSPRCDWL